jgi:NAD(P)-dependent dehydrogenase (short-subunit alcohol dehydrogenase family)
MKSVVVTGVSTGIGWGATKVLTRKGFHVFGSVRKQADADRLKQEFGDRFTPLLFDVTDEAAVRAGAEQVRAALKGQKLFGLVNNAGIAVAGPLLHLPVSEFRQQMEVNLTGVVIATQAFAPLLGADETLDGEAGRIVMISSVGGKSGTPFMAPYNASKFALEGLSEALRRELMIYGIDVIVVAPGAVSTEIWGKAEQVDVTPYASTKFAPALDKVRAFMLLLAKSGLEPEVLGEVIHRALTTPKPKVRYTVTPEPLQHAIQGLLPKRMVDGIFAKRLGLTR